MNDIRKSVGWADLTWNPVTGCRHTCPYCYARKMAWRFGQGTNERDFIPTFHPERLGEPEAREKPAHIFVGSACDLFGAWVDESWISGTLTAMNDAPWHRYYLLTKNPIRYSARPMPDKAWLGFTAETQAAYCVREMCMPRRERNFVSLEPLQGPVRIGRSDLVSWVIVGQETGNRRERVRVKPQWVTDIVTDCRAKGIPVYVKGNVPEHDKWGKWPQEKPKGRKG